MSSKALSRMLIWVGVLLLLFGVFMDTSVETSIGDLVNASLLAKQQMLLTLGGIGVIAGILLYGIGKLKQDPREPARESEETRKAQDAMNKETQEALDRAKANGEMFGARFKAKLNDHRSQRLVSGAVVGLWLGGFAVYYLSGLIGITVFAACMAYAVFAADAQRGQTRLFAVAWVVAVIVATHLAIVMGPLLPWSDVGWRDAGILVSLLFLHSPVGITLIGVIGWFFAYRWARRNARYVSSRAPTH